MSRLNNLVGDHGEIRTSADPTLTTQDLCGMTEVEAMAFDDDGHGTAVGASEPAEDFGNAIPTTDDSGVQWGPASDVATRALVPNLNDGPASFSLALGQLPTVEQEDALIANAKEIIERSRGNVNKYRFFVLGFTFPDGADATIGDKAPDHYDLVGNVPTSLASVAIKNELINDMAARTGIPAAVLATLVDKEARAGAEGFMAGSDNSLEV